MQAFISIYWPHAKAFSRISNAGPLIIILQFLKTCYNIYALFIMIDKVYFTLYMVFDLLIPEPISFRLENYCLHITYTIFSIRHSIILCYSFILYIFVSNLPYYADGCSYTCGELK